MTIGGNAIPMGFNQLGKPSIRLQSLPFQAVLPSFKEGAGTALGSVIPELAEGFLEEVGGVQTPVGLEQFFSGLVCHSDSGSCVVRARYIAGP